MKRIAADIDQLMWTVAERGDARAIADFETRFPELKLELAKRVSMVGSLRKARPSASSASIPAFHPQGGVSPFAGFSPRVRWSMALTGLAALAGASYVITGSLLQSPAAPVAKPDVKQVVQDPVHSGADPVETPYPRGNPEPQYNAHVDEEYVMPPQEVKPKYDMPQTISLDRVSLAMALQAIAAQSGLTLEIAPGMPDPEISLRVAGKTGLQIMKDMGAEYGFSAMDQGDGKVLIIPAVDGNADPKKAVPEIPLDAGG